MGSSGVSASIFRVASHTLVRCEEGTLEVEATLFPASSEARAHTSAGEARARLARSGLTPAFAGQARDAISAAALASYVRADCLRPILSKLGPSEVFAGRVYHPDVQAYEGAWIDLRALASDLHVPGAGLVLQGLHLVSVLDELSPATPVSIENGGDGKAARIAFLKPHSLIGALGQLAARPPRSRRDEDERVRAELARFLRDQSTFATPSARARHLGIEQALATLDKPTRGRLSDIQLWTIERQLEAGDIRGALERIQTYVRANGGETAATRYLRAHLALVEGSEPPRRIAESLIEEGPPFYELELLKARAWLAAEVWAYAHHFARALVDDPNVSDAVSLAALEIVDAVSARMGRGTPVPVAPWDAAPPSTERLLAHHANASAHASASGSSSAGATGASSARSGGEARTPEEAKSGSILASPIFMVVANPVESLPPSYRHVDAVPSSLDLPMSVADPISEAPLSEDAPPTQVEITQEVDLEQLEQVPDSADLEAPTQIFEPVHAPNQRAYQSAYVNAYPSRNAYGHATANANANAEQQYDAGNGNRRYEGAREHVHVAEPIFDEPASPRPHIPIDRGHMTDRPPPMQAMALAMRPRMAMRYVPEEVESLALPPGLEDRQLPEGVAARNGDEVRIVSTRFARLIGREYREKYGVQLRTDATAVEFMQKHLLERWGHTGINGPEATWDVRRHGALLSEILARSLGAAWVDVSPTEIGYWAMFVPPRTRTWPFGRVHRFLSLGHREKDLVSYYLDLVTRARDA